jgi:hypothetical protein
MAENDRTEFKFPDEMQEDAVDSEARDKADDEALTIDIEDDTPEADRNVEPMPIEAVEALEKDDLNSYSKKVKTRLGEMKKVWHDERRAKETASREREEAVSLAQRVLEENRRLKATLSQGEKHYVTSIQGAADMEVEMAKRTYRDAYDSGDADRIVDAQQKLTEASLKQDKAKNFKTTLQTPETDVEPQLQATSVQATERKVDPTTAAWLAKNTWYGSNTVMSALALGLHNELEGKYGAQYTGSAEYFQRIDSEVRKRFPENFSDETQTQAGESKPSLRTDTKSAAVVAPATRSTASKRIVLKASQVNLAKRLGLTNEQYAREMQKLEA